MQPKDLRLATERDLENSIGAATAPLDQRLEDLEVSAGFTPGDINDTTAASLIRNPESETATELSAAITQVAVLEGSAFSDISKQPGVDNTGTIECATAIQSALDSFATFGVRAYACGTFKVASTVTFTSHADFSDAHFNYTPTTGIALQVGLPTTATHDITVTLPSVTATAKTTIGWGQVEGTTAVRVSNLYSCIVTTNRCLNFETGFWGHGQTPSGTSYTTFNLGHFQNCKVGGKIEPQSSGTKSTSGWFNNNKFNLGRFSHGSNEGTQVPGTRNFVIADATNEVNNNIFEGTSFESLNVTEYHLDIAGQYNKFTYCRYENTGGVAARKVLWRSAAKDNVIEGGFNSGQLNEIFEPGAVSNLISDQLTRRVGGSATVPLHLFENRGSNSGSIQRFMPAGATSTGVDIGTGWLWDYTGNEIKGKRTGDVYPRIILDAVNGRLYVGAGAAAPTSYFGSLNANLAISGTVAFTPDNTHDLGLTSFRPRYIRAGTGIQTGSFTTATRPPASSAGVGMMIFDTTLGKPIWANGNNWVDASGVAV